MRDSLATLAAMQEQLTQLQRDRASLEEDLAKREEVDRVSTAGYALGYVGGGLLLALDLFLIESWESVGLPSKGFAVRFGFFLVAVWWAIFTLPLLRRVPAQRGDGADAGQDRRCAMFEAAGIGGIIESVEIPGKWIVLGKPAA